MARLTRSRAVLGLWSVALSLVGCALYEPGLLGSEGADWGAGGRLPASAGKLDATAGCTVVVIAAGGSSDALSAGTTGNGSIGGAAATAGSEAGRPSADDGGSIASGGTLGAGAGAANSSTAGSMPNSGLAGSGMAGSGAAGSVAPLPLIELARGRAVRSSNHQAGNDASHGNDGDTGTRWCASDGSFPQFWRVDLGAQHSLQDFSVRFEHATATYGYTIETSNDDAVYLLRLTVTGTGAVQTVTFPERISARYVRVTVTRGSTTSDGHPSWASFSELMLNGY